MNEPQDWYLADSGLVHALTADASEEELAGEELAVAAFRHAMRTTGPHRRRRHRLASRVSATAAASALVLSATAAAAAAYTTSLPPAAQLTVHHLFHRLGVPAPLEHRQGHSPASAAGARPDDPGWTAAGRGSKDAGPDQDRRSASGGSDVTLALWIDHAVIAVGQHARVEVREQGARINGRDTLVAIETRAPGTQSWALASWMHLSSSGAATALVGPVPHALDVRAVFRSPDGRVATSPVQRLGARPVMTLQRSSTSTLTLRTDPGQRARVVELQEQRGGAWMVVLRATVDAVGEATFRLPTTPDHTSRVYRTLLRASELFDPSTSAPLRLTPA